MCCAESRCNRVSKKGDLEGCLGHEGKLTGKIKKVYLTRQNVEKQR